MSARITIAAFIAYLKGLVAKKRRVQLAYVWYGELSIGALLLVAVLSFDWAVYRSLVMAPPDLPQEEFQKIITLDERAVKQAAEIITRHAAFLEHPTLPSLIQSPF